MFRLNLLHRSIREKVALAWPYGDSWNYVESSHLYSLQKIQNDQEKIADAGAIHHAVRSLARDVKESRLAVALLLELSKDPVVCERIGRVQGCILLLVSMSNNGDQEAAHDAKQLLNNLSSDNQNVVQMAEANYFKPLVQHLLEGMHFSFLIKLNFNTTKPSTTQFGID